MILPLKQEELSCLFENIDTSESQFHMEISLEDRSYEEPDEFDYTIDDGMYSDCEYGEEALEDDEEELYEDGTLSDETGGTDPTTQNQIFELLRRSTKESILTILRHIYRGSSNFLEAYDQFVPILK